LVLVLVLVPGLEPGLGLALALAPELGLEPHRQSNSQLITALTELTIFSFST